jgi:hypothetical protein
MELAHKGAQRSAAKSPEWPDGWEVEISLPRDRWREQLFHLEAEGHTRAGDPRPKLTGGLRSESSEGGFESAEQVPSIFGGWSAFANNRNTQGGNS